MPTRIAFRTDASLQIGTGHVMRCLALAEALRSRGAEIHFICRELRGNVLAAVRAAGHRLHVLPAPAKPEPAGNATPHAQWLEVAQATDVAQTRAALEALGGVELLVVDHYALAADWEQSLRAVAATICVIDDLADRPHDCDLLLDQTPESQQRYYSLVPAQCRLLAGTTYVLLRPEFAKEQRRAAPRSGAVRRVLVCFGGVDSANHTARTLEALRLLRRPELPVDVVAGMANPHVDALREQCAGMANVRFHHAPTDLPGLMAQADLAVGAGGVMLWERACMGLPAVAIVAADNQRLAVEALATAGQVVALESVQATPQRLAQTLESLLSQAARLNEMSRLNHQRIDGRGCERVARILVPPVITLRPAAEPDRDAVFRWRNTEEVRRSSKDPAEITRETHDRWFSSVLANPHRALFIAEYRNEAIGVLRYDLSPGEARVSIYLAPGKGGQGYGPAILRSGTQWLRRHHPQVRRVNAEVLPGNSASRRAFEEAGYKLDQSVYRQHLP